MKPTEELITVARPNATELGCLSAGGSREVIDVFTFLLLLATIVYVLPVPPRVWIHGVDESWIAFFSLAFRSGKQFGTDIVFTYGPWGFLVDPRNVQGIYPWLILGRAVLSIGCCVGLSTLAVRWISRPSLRVLWASVIFLIAEPTYLIVPLLCLLLWREPAVDTWAKRLALHLVAISAGLAANTKFTCLILLGGLLLALLPTAEGRRLSVTALFSWLGFWLLAGQPLHGIPAFIANSFEVARGYSTAMAVEPLPLAQLFGVVLCGLPLLVCAVAERRKSTLQSLALFCWLVGFEYLTLAQSLVRCDADHLGMGFVFVSVPIALVLSASPHLWSASAPGPTGKQFLFIGIVVLCGGFAGLTAGPVFVDRVARVLIGIRNTPLEWVSAVPQLSSTTALASAGTDGVDVFPSDLEFAFNSSLPLVNRPIPQAYSSYTARLATLNSKFLESPKAPQKIYFEVAPIDERYPTLEDPIAWRTLLTHYQPEKNLGGYLVLKRRSLPLQAVLRLIKSQDFKLGERIEVPLADGEMCWAEIDARPNWRGTLLSLAMDTQQLRLEIGTDRGSRTYRFIQETAKSGFLLSPSIDSPDTMQKLYSREQVNNDLQRVDAFVLRGTDRAVNSFSRMITVKLYSLTVK